ncbi:RNase H domain-containing protein [Trichonephila clavipes]|nr:RNase H domain-containing protein [Trichonephila clavipes]
MNGTSLVLPSLNIDKVSEHARFLILSLPNNEMLQKSPFAIHKAIQGISGEPKSVKKLRSGDLLIETSSALQTKSLLLTKTFLDCPLIVNLHRSLNSCRGVISETDLLCASEAEILDGLSDQGVTEVRRIKIKKETSLFPTKHLILTFNSPNLPSKIKAGYLNCKLRPYIPNPLRCFKCQRFGHSQNSCRGQLTCSRCAAVGHSSTDCTLEPKCINCSQIHTADSKLCPKWKTEKEIQTIKTNKNISYFEARKLIAPQFSQTYAQVAKPSIATSSTQTDENITKVKCPPLQILKPLLSVPHPNTSPSITSNSTSSSTTQVNLLPSASSIKPTTQTESRLHEPISSAAAPDNSLNTSASSLSTETRLLKTSNKFAALSTEIQSLVPQVHLLPSTSTVATVSEPQPPNPTFNDTPSITNTHQMKTMFTPLPAETCPTVETATSITDTFPFTSQDAKQTLKSRKKRRPKRSITSKIDTQLTPHKPTKSIPLQDTSDEDMLIYDVAEEVESPQKLTPVNEIEKFSDEWWQAEGWKREEYSRTLTPTRNRKSRIKNLVKFGSCANKPKKVTHSLTVAPVVFQRVFAYHRSQYSRYSAIYTDGSKRADYVGCGVVIEDIMHGYRLDTSCSVFTAEAVAIYRALQLIDSNMPRKYCIYTDSMSVLEALENYNDRCHPVVCKILDITSRLYSKGFDIVFCWLPSHVGIIGNEQADSAAKSATTHLPLAVPLSDMKRVIMHHIFKIWQESWSQQLDNKLHSVKPVIGAWPVMPMRRTDVKLTRLRIGHTRFTHRHLLFGVRAPECPSCNVSYTVHHILIDCPVFNHHRITFFHTSILTLSDLVGESPHQNLFAFMKKIGFLYFI